MQAQKTNHKPLIKPAVILVNLGSPEKPTAFHIAVFLKNFLWDPRIVKINRLLWWFVLHFIVIPLRSFRVAKLYQKIWTSKGSPLIVHTQALAEGLALDLLKEKGLKIPIFVAMTYGKPSLKNTLEEIRKQEITDLIVLPLFPQYASYTTLPAFDLLSTLMMKHPLPSLYFISHYCHEQVYLEGLATSIREYWQKAGKQDRLLFSFHGIPEQAALAGELYPKHCEHTARAVAEILKLPDNYWKIAYQSRFGWRAWLGPNLIDQLHEWIREGVKTVLVIAPSFAVDCLETLEEIKLNAAETFIKAGGHELHYVPALNASRLQIGILKSIIEKYF